MNEKALLYMIFVIKDRLLPWKMNLPHQIFLDALIKLATLIVRRLRERYGEQTRVSAMG